MTLNEKEQFIVKLSITILEHIPLQYAKKRTLSDLECILIDSIYDKLSDENIERNIEFNYDERKLILEAICNCIKEEQHSVLTTGKSVCFQNYLSNKFGNIVNKDFVGLVEKMNLDSK